MPYAPTATFAPLVTDLVLDPFLYSDLIGPLVREGLLPTNEADHLAGVLPAAIAQLDALGDAYGAIALAAIYAQLAGQQALA